MRGVPGFCVFFVGNWTYRLKLNIQRNPKYNTKISHKRHDFYHRYSIQFLKIDERVVCLFVLK